MKIKRKNIIMAFFIFAIALRSFTAPYESAGFISQIKYGVCLVGAVYTYIVMFKKCEIRLYRYEYRSILKLVLIFSVLSLFFIVINTSFTTRTIFELLYLWMPAFYSYVLINTLDFEDVYTCMSWSLILYFIGYILNLGMSFAGMISSISSISFNDSYSLLESSVYAAPSVTTAIFFLYYRKNKILTILSVIFVLMTFKRLSVLFVVFLLVLPIFCDINKPVSKRVIRITKWVFFILTIAYFFLMRPETVRYIFSRFNFDLYKFTMSRTYRFSLIYGSNNFISCGLGSTYTYLNNIYGVTLEMDLLKILFELGPLGVIVIINQMFNIVRHNRYCFIVMVYLFFNLLFSHSLADMFGWLALHVIFACIQYKNNNNPNPKWEKT